MRFRHKGIKKQNLSVLLIELVQIWAQKSDTLVVFFQKQRMSVLLCVLYSVILNSPTDFSPRLIKYRTSIGIDFYCEVM